MRSEYDITAHENIASPNKPCVQHDYSAVQQTGLMRDFNGI